ncbi:2-C-methyl-D-erythritol 4-phosphate cytidylyltransferase [Oceanospirillum sp. D5]|uniref:2-C-methyl-D-erythritol 4-phosphate cytidylyltransferase n=2 Tax=Oceanospirillum sediminis TaxID=2760088 RepID=A0A839II79_9GAMM|nr:2-C-methyl-D-erythritol 4-phosphate cytidylyltransferase [Oceanospirillum sediminis]
MNNRIWFIVPAAGTGSRMQADRPKQYLSLAGRPVIEHTLQRLTQALPDAAVVLCLNPDDPWWPDISTPDCELHLAEGGKERCDSVLNGLNLLSGKAADNDWILVHDVARPCVRTDDIRNLVSSLQDDETGGILALPVADTMKRAADQNPCVSRIEKTVDRNQMWHALTPQMFRYGLLKSCLERALAEGVQITDEASAVEWGGYQPALIKGQRDNLKITHPDDLWFAELFLNAQQADSE